MIFNVINWRINLNLDKMGRPTDAEPEGEDGAFDIYELIESTEADPDGENEPIPTGPADDCEDVSDCALDFGGQVVLQSIQIDYTELGTQFTGLPDRDLAAFFTAFSEKDFLAEFRELTDPAYLAPAALDLMKESLWALLDLPPAMMGASNLSSVHDELDTIIKRAEGFSSENALANRNAKVFIA